MSCNHNHTRESNSLLDTRKGGRIIMWASWPPGHYKSIPELGNYCTRIIVQSIQFYGSDLTQPSSTVCNDDCKPGFSPPAACRVELKDKRRSRRCTRWISTYICLMPQICFNYQRHFCTHCSRQSALSWSSCFFGVMRFKKPLTCW